MTIHLYFARRLLWTFVGIALIFLTLLVLVDLMEQLRRFDVEELGFARILELALLNAPETLYKILPLLILLSTITLFIGLARSSELVVVRATGRSALVSLLSPAMVALLIGFLAVSTVNPIIATTSQRYQTLVDSYRYGEQNSTLSISSEGLWLRQGGAGGQAVIHAASTNPDASVFNDVSIVTYVKGGGVNRRIEADSAQLTEGAWLLKNARVWPIIAGINPESGRESHDMLRLESSLTLDRIRDSLGSPSVISVWDLPGFIRDLEEAGFSSRRHGVWLQTELTQPLFLVAMVLVAAAFTMRHTRFGRTGVAVLSAILAGFALYYIRNFAQILGENGQIPVALAAWAPPVASVLMALGLLLHMEDG